MSERENAIALYTFLKEFVQLRTRTIRDIDRYEQVIWVSDIPREPGCKCIAWHREAEDDSNEEWLEIQRPRLTPPPDPPETVIAWVRRDQVEDSSLDIPELHTSIPGESAQKPPLRLEDHPEVQAAWDTYVTDQWWGWADQDRREQALLRTYTDLFTIFQRQQQVGETFEIVFGLGFLSWSTPDGQTVRRHLVSARVSVEFDPESGTLTVIPAGEGSLPSLEQDMLDPQYRPEPQELDSIEKKLEEIGESVWEVGPLDGLLKSWVHTVDAKGEYRAALEIPERTVQSPVVHLAPALILRRRSERSYIRSFDDVIAQLENDETVPDGVSHFINASINHLGPTKATKRVTGTGREVFFPLPANDAQRQIVERLNTNRGVLVQGPPGTGKSHTIVNLICHALASGQRVLVTSHAARALDVLQSMIREKAPDLAPLSVVLLGNDREALRAMEASVQGITTRYHSWSPMDSQLAQLTIEKLEAGLDKVRRREARLLADLRAIREQETVEYRSKFGYSGKLAEIAITLREEREELGWIPDETVSDVESLNGFDGLSVEFVALSGSQTDAPDGMGPPLSTDHFKELVSILRDERVGEWEASGWASLDEGGRPVIDIARLPPTEAFERAVRSEQEARAACKTDASIRRRPEYGALHVASDQERHDFADRLEKLTRTIEHIERRSLPWTGAATRQILAGAGGTWRQLYEDTQTAIRSLKESAKWLDANSIIPAPITDLPELRADASDLLDHLNAGGGWGFGPFRAKVVKRALYIRELRIGGRLCERADTLNDLLRRLEAELETRRLRERWEPHHDLTATNFTDLAAELEDLCQPLEEAFAALATSRKPSVTLQRANRCPELIGRTAPR